MIQKRLVKKILIKLKRVTDTVRKQRDTVKETVKITIVVNYCCFISGR